MTNLEKEYLWGLLIIGAIVLVDMTLYKMLTAIFSFEPLGWKLILSLVLSGGSLVFTVYKYAQTD